MTEERSRATLSQPWLNRRGALALLGLGAAAAVLAACREDGGERTDARSDNAGDATDFAARFATYEPAEEPDGDTTKVVWPAFVLQAGPEVQRLYEFQIMNGELMRYMPCFCGCGASGHRNNRDCYIKEVNPDGSVVFDAMAPT